MNDNESAAAPISDDTLSLIPGHAEVSRALRTAGMMRARPSSNAGTGLFTTTAPGAGAGAGAPTEQTTLMRNPAFGVRKQSTERSDVDEERVATMAKRIADIESSTRTGLSLTSQGIPKEIQKYIQGYIDTDTPLNIHDIMLQKAPDRHVGTNFDLHRTINVKQKLVDRLEKGSGSDDAEATIWADSSLDTPIPKELGQLLSYYNFYKDRHNLKRRLQGLPEKDISFKIDINTPGNKIDINKDTKILEKQPKPDNLLRAVGGMRQKPKTESIKRKISRAMYPENWTPYTISINVDGKQGREDAIQFLKEYNVNIMSPEEANDLVELRKVGFVYKTPKGVLKAKKK